MRIKKNIYFIFTILLFSKIHSQQIIEKNFQITRVPLKEKFNLAARSFPRLLIKAFCEGKIAGYYPLRPQQECSYHEFVSHFNTANAQPTAKGTTENNVPCPNVFCINANDPALEPFCLYYDIYEEKLFSGQSGTGSFKLKFIRLVYTVEKHGGEAFYPGPFFKYDDVIALSDKEYSIMNQKNPGAYFTFKQYFESRIFTGNVLNASGDDKKTNQNKENDKWQH